MARKISYQQAINEALAQEMRRDQSVFIIGQDVSGGTGAPGEQDAWGGVLAVTARTAAHAGADACHARAETRSLREGFEYCTP
eukprot:gene3048-3934_t